MKREGPPIRVAMLASCLITIAAGACAPPAAREEAGTAAARDTSYAIPIEWLADTAGTSLLPVEPRPTVWVARIVPASGSPPAPALPEPMPAVPEAPARAPMLEIDPGLKPPIPKRPARIVPVTLHTAPASVVLEVQVDRAGRVGEVRWAAGSRDAALIESAIACARTMEFFPALRAGEPVAVWCRQRFNFPGSGPE